jgi:site-specific recombinase XerD
LFVFSVRDGKLKNQPIGKNYFNNSMLKPALQNAGLPANIVAHSIRATVATQLFHLGVDEQLIKERLVTAVILLRHTNGLHQNKLSTYKHY